jgi:hypothetical protein
MSKARLDKLLALASKIKKPKKRKYPHTWIMYGDQPPVPKDFDGEVILILPEDWPRIETESDKN